MFKKAIDNISFRWAMFKSKMKDRDTAGKYARKLLIKTILTIIKYVLIASIAFVFLYPFLYMIVTAMKSPNDLADPTVTWVPTYICSDNFYQALRALSYEKTVVNSLLVTVISTVGHLLSAALAGYGLTRYNFKFRGVLLVVLVLTIIVPPQVTSIPTYITYSKLGIMGLKGFLAYLPIVLPSFFGAGLKGGIYIFIFRQFYMGVPTELEEAARVDGCGPFSTFTKIILPMSKAPFLVNLVLSIVWHWTDTYQSILYIKDKSSQMVIARLPLLFETLQREPETEEEAIIANIYTEGVVMAATFMVVLPVLVIYFFLQNQFTQGVERSGIVG